MRDMIHITATMVSIDLNTHHATRSSSVSGDSGLPHLPESMVISEADKSYFIVALSLHAWLQQLSRAMA
jgi:hypothetical protein